MPGEELLTLLLEALAEPVADMAGHGRRKRLAKRELRLCRLADRVADGNPVLGVVLALERRASFAPEERPSWAPADKAVVENLRELVRAP